LFIGFVCWIGTLLLFKIDKTPQMLFTAINVMYISSAAAGMAAGNIPSMARAKQAS
jgi:hypothetical protein